MENGGTDNHNSGTERIGDLIDTGATIGPIDGIVSPNSGESISDEPALGHYGDDSGRTGKADRRTGKPKLSDAGKSRRGKDGSSNSGGSGGGSGDRGGKRRGSGKYSGRGDAGTGAERRSETGREAEEGTKQADEDIPRRVVLPGFASGKSKKKKSAAEGGKAEKQILITLIATGLTAGYGSIAIWRKEDHWKLQEREAKALAEQVDACLETLPDKVYEQFVKQIENFAPWIGLAITAGAVTLPRIQESQRRNAAANQRPKAAPFVGYPPNDSGNRSEEEFRQEFVDADSDPFTYGSANSFHGGSRSDG